MPALENRGARLEEGIDRLLDPDRAEQALKNSQLPGMDFEYPPSLAPERSLSRLFSGDIRPAVLTRDKATSVAREARSNKSVRR